MSVCVRVRERDRSRESERELASWRVHHRSGEGCCIGASLCGLMADHDGDDSDGG